MSTRDQHGQHGQHGHRYPGSVEALRSPDRVARLEAARVVDLCLEALGAADVETVLDVGTGSGVFAEEFAGRGLRVTGVDVNPAMLEAARRAVPRARFLEAPAEALPFADGAYDLAFLGHVLHEVDDGVRALREARRVARRRVAVLEWTYRAEEVGPPLAHRLRDEAIEAAAEEAGFRRVERLPLAHATLHRLTP